MNRKAMEILGEYQKLQAEGRYGIEADMPTIAFNEIGKRGIRCLDGYEKASGKAAYTKDIQLPGMLYARVFMSPHARARIKRMDTSKAETLPGVRLRPSSEIVLGFQQNPSQRAMWSK